MGYCTWWTTIVLCFTAFAASQNNETPEPSMMPFDNNETPEPSMMPFDDNNTPDPHMSTLFDIAEMEDDNEEDVVEHAKEERADPHRDFMETNPTVVNGQPLFEGDMLLTKSQWRAIRERKAIAFPYFFWDEGPDGYPLVPYMFPDSRVNKTVIVAGMNHWMEHTCIKFEETTNKNQPHVRYIYGGGCYSSVGMRHSNGQYISIGRGCELLGIVAHEIGHTIGFFHEQSRPDRDDYVVVNSVNIPTNRAYNFRKYSTYLINTHNITYDYTSDMHYRSSAFTINGKTTLATINPLAQPLIGQRIQLSHRDKHLANIMYKCIDKWLAKCGESFDPCQNGGYYGKNCKCVCPPGTSGSKCEAQTGCYYDEVPNSCSEKVTTEGILTSPGFPRNYPIGQCVKWIVAPECHVPRLTFTYFQLYSKSPYCNGNTCCYFDALEIRTVNRNYGDVFCSRDITAGRSFTSNNREMILYFRTRSNYYRGWCARLTFVKQAGCK